MSTARGSVLFSCRYIYMYIYIYSTAAVIFSTCEMFLCRVGNRLTDEEPTITVNKLLQGFERARLSRSLRLLLVSLQHLVHVRILDAGQSPGAEHTQTDIQYSSVQHNTGSGRKHKMHALLSTTAVVYRKNSTYFSHKARSYGGPRGSKHSNSEIKTFWRAKVFFCELLCFVKCWCVLWIVVFCTKCFFSELLLSVVKCQCVSLKVVAFS